MYLLLRTLGTWNFLKDASAPNCKFWLHFQSEAFINTSEKYLSYPQREPKPSDDLGRFGRGEERDATPLSQLRELTRRWQ